MGVLVDLLGLRSRMWWEIGLREKRTEVPEVSVGVASNAAAQP